MNITVRNYKPLSDFEPIRQFLIKNHQYHNADGNVYPSEWEYMHTHSLAPWILFPRIGIWEDNGEIVAVATLEWFLGEFMLQINPDYAFLKPELLHYAEENLSVMNADGTRTLCVSRLHNTDTEMEELLIRQGYHMAADSGWAGFSTFPERFLNALCLRGSQSSAFRKKMIWKNQSGYVEGIRASQ